MALNPWFCTWLLEQQFDEPIVLTASLSGCLLVRVQLRLTSPSGEWSQSPLDCCSCIASTVLLMLYPLASSVMLRAVFPRCLTTSGVACAAFARFLWRLLGHTAKRGLPILGKDATDAQQQLLMIATSS